MNYKQSGVDVVAGEKAVDTIKSTVKKTYNNNVLSGLGSFGGLYKLELSKWKEPIMVSSTDGVGTKIIIAQKAKIYNTIGQDLVNHCVNDIFVQGAIPQFFLDYIGISNIDIAIINQIIDGMSLACIENGLALVGGEMAEMPDIYKKDDFDLVGTIVGLVEKKNLVTGETIKKDDVILGFPSTGLHTNGYSLARKIIFEKLKLGLDDYVPEIGDTVKDAMLKIHKSYYPILNKYAENHMINGMAHITGGGLYNNIKRVVPEGLTAFIDKKSWEIPSLFNWLIKSGEVEEEDAYRAFNMGIGFVVITTPDNAKIIMKENDCMQIGKIIIP